MSGNLPFSLHVTVLDTVFLGEYRHINGSTGQPPRHTPMNTGYKYSYADDLWLDILHRLRSRHTYGALKLLLCLHAAHATNGSKTLDPT